MKHPFLKGLNKRELPYGGLMGGGFSRVDADLVRYGGTNKTWHCLCFTYLTWDFKESSLGKLGSGNLHTVLGQTFKLQKTLPRRQSEWPVSLSQKGEIFDHLASPRTRSHCSLSIRHTHVPLLPQRTYPGELRMMNQCEWCGRHSSATVYELGTQQEICQLCHQQLLKHVMVPVWRSRNRKNHTLPKAA